MVNIIQNNPLSPEEQMRLMAEDTKFDVADEVSDGLNAAEVCDLSDIRSKSAPPKVPKVMLSNDCIFNCAYCGCRAGNEQRRRYCNNPKQLAKTAVDEAVKNGHGVFITSSICKNADYTEELIVETLKVIRREFRYSGYIHAKIMPGADPLLIREAGLYANRLSVNIEVAKSEGYARIAKQKNKQNILAPMRQISELIAEANTQRGKAGRFFASSQTTQLMAGSTGEDDRTILALTKALYKKYNLKRVYYTPFQYRHPAEGYDLPFVSTPYWRMSRLYQADRLLQLYGFSPDEVTPQNSPNLECGIDPKAAWAIRNLHLFPVEVNRADYEELIRIPGIGLTYARKILKARTHCILTHDLLKKIGVPLKRCIFFITCNGRYLGGEQSPETLRSLLSNAEEATQLSFI